ncbi:MAG TPA: phytanoyl-CoA dioxygenase family protein [Ktedonobacteraceae bacterium]|nr:phytanoyl-CoA dioxygenase family protein [Ktedonobacteraceae bacterium]
MYFSEEQVALYNKQGFVLIEDAVSEEDLTRIAAEVPVIYACDYPGRVFEKGSTTVRAVHGPHLFNETFGRLTRYESLVKPSMQILKSSVYVHQFKINAKAALDGDLWKWHQDYQFWRDEDGMPTDRVINAAIFLDDVTEFNGPLIFVPGSHREGLIEMQEQQAPDYIQQDDRSWVATVSADLKYTVDKPRLSGLVRQYGLISPKGPRGSILFFHPNIVHGSAPNMSPFDRTLVVITYNSVENRLRDVPSPRPEFMASRNAEPVIPLPSEVLWAS